MIKKVNLSKTGCVDSIHYNFFLKSCSYWINVQYMCLLSDFKNTSKGQIIIALAKCCRLSNVYVFLERKKIPKPFPALNGKHKCVLPCQKVHLVIR